MFSKLIVFPTVTLMLHEPLAIISMQKDYLNVTENKTKIMEILVYCPSNEVSMCLFKERSCHPDSSTQNLTATHTKPEV